MTQPVTLAPGASTTVTFTPASYPQLVIRHPQLWWPYQMGGQPLYRLRVYSASGPGGGPPDVGRAAGGVRHPPGQPRT